MPRQHRPGRHGPAIGTPLMLDGSSRAKRKRDRSDYWRTAGIVAGGVLLAYLTRGQHGHVALIVGCLSVLAATCYWHRRNPDRVALLVGVVPVVLVLGMALALTPATKPAARRFTAGASSYSETMSAGAVTGVGDVAQWVLGKLADLASGMVKP